MGVSARLLPWRRTVRLPTPHEPGALAARVRGAHLTRGASEVLRGVDLDVRAGEVRALLGPNGAGKSSLLGVLTGDLAPSAGAVEIDGEPLAHWSTTELALRRSVLLQHVGVSFPFTVTEVVRMGRAPWRGTPLDLEDDEAVAQGLADADVTHLADRQFTALSGGERARAALARVLAQRTQVLLLDEPTAALDLRHQELVLQLARGHARAGGAVVVVVHDLGLAAAYADQVTVLAHGRVVAEGPPAEALTSELLSEVYEYPVEVFAHPRSARQVILPRR